MSESDSDNWDSPTQILPEKSLLSLEEYLEMQRTVGDETNFRVLYALKRIGDADPEDIADTLNMDTDRVQSGLDELGDAGLVARRMRKTPEMDEGEVYIYYRANSIGKGLLEEGIEELIRQDWESLERYS